MFVQSDNLLVHPRNIVLLEAATLSVKNRYLLHYCGALYISCDSLPRHCGLSRTGRYLHRCNLPGVLKREAIYMLQQLLHVKFLSFSGTNVLLYFHFKIEKFTNKSWQRFLNRGGFSISVAPFLWETKNRKEGRPKNYYDDIERRREGRKC